MDRYAIEQQLQEAKAHLALGEKHVSRQRRIVAALETGGHDASRAKDKLQTFEVTHAISVEDVTRLVQELAATR
jgi:hypothetical protein